MTEDDYYKEKNLTGGKSKSTDIAGMEIIFQQINKSICKIICKKGHGSGFFSTIPFPDELNTLKVLITNNHVLGENDIKVGSKINIFINDEKIRKTIVIDEKRKTYTSQKYDITIIELKKDDPFKNDIISFLEIDNLLLKKDNLNIELNNKNNLCK